MKSHSNDPNMPEEGPYDNNWPLSPSDMEGSSPSQWPLYDYALLLSPWNTEDGEDGDAETRDMMLSQEPLNNHHQHPPQMAAAPLDVAGTSVALNGSSTGISGSSAVPPPNQAPVASNPSQSGCQNDAKGKALASTNPPMDPSGTAFVMPAPPSREEQAGSQGRLATSESSPKDSHGDIGGGIPIPEDMDPVQARILKRKLSNRESASRSRLRKKEHMTELENQVGQLKERKSLLLEQLSRINQKRDAALVNNRILKADIEALKANVKLAEETVWSLTGIHPGFVEMNQATVEASLPGTMHSQQTWNAFPPDQSAVPAAPLHAGLQSELTHNSPAPVRTIPFNDAVRAGSMNTMQNVVDIQHPQRQGHYRPDDISFGAEGATAPDHQSNAVARNK